MYDLSLGGTSIMCIKPFITELEFSWGWRSCRVAFARGRGNRQPAPDRTPRAHGDHRRRFVLCPWRPRATATRHGHAGRAREIRMRVNHVPVPCSHAAVPWIAGLQVAFRQTRRNASVLCAVSAF